VLSCCLESHSRITITLFQSQNPYCTQTETNRRRDMLCASKKPFRLCDSVTKFPQIKENDGNIELDSLEDCEKVSEPACQTAKIIRRVQDEDDDIGDNDQVKQLNLNGLCKGKEELGECYVDEIVLPGESLQSLSDLKVLSLRSNGIQNFPNSILQLITLVTLDLSDNSLLTLPPEISLLEK
jgi:Leucine-rich repeat (LRR) protein